MIDWHSHVLPGMDDGSRDAEESIALLEMLRSQGVDTVAATPHFYPNDESAERFLERRAQCLEALRGHLSEDSPRIVVGAEVYYYNGISRMKELPLLKLEGTRLLLLEMPMCTWSEYTVRELSELTCRGNMQIVIAHLDRYLKLQKKSTLEQIFESGALVQLNAAAFTSFSSRRAATSLLKEGRAHFIGSDCHNLTSRAPRIGEAYDIIRKKLGEDFVSQMTDFGYSCLDRQSPTIDGTEQN